MVLLINNILIYCNLFIYFIYLKLVKINFLFYHKINFINNIDNLKITFINLLII